MNGLELRKHRKTLGLTQSELAKKVLVTTRTIQNYEKNTKEIPKNISITIKNLLKINSEDENILGELDHINYLKNELILKDQIILLYKNQVDFLSKNVLTTLEKNYELSNNIVSQMPLKNLNEDLLQMIKQIHHVTFSNAIQDVIKENKQDEKKENKKNNKLI